jgi:Zn-dependent peptidase ImmA (M78 family)/transcriptional regulator with XRE-family HTH domain
MIDAAELGRRLKEARGRRALSQDQVAVELSLPRPAVSQIEAGRRAVSTLELARLAQLFNEPIESFVADEPASRDQNVLVVLHRAAGEFLDDPAYKNELERCVTICREGVQLERLLGEDRTSGLPLYGLRAPASAGEAIRQGEQIAEQERQRLDLGHDPIGELPELIARQGIWTASTALPPDVSGVFVHHREVGLAIFVNRHHPVPRWRFSLAHEFAHALLDREAGPIVSRQANANQLIEKRANAFAATFLVPAQGVSEFLREVGKGEPSRRALSIFDVATGDRGDGETRPPRGSQALTAYEVARLAHRFIVSYETAVYRLKNLGHVAQAASTRLLEQKDIGRQFLHLLYSFEGFDVAPNASETGRRQRELVPQVASLAVEAFRRGEISRGRLRDLGRTLNVSGDKLADLAEASAA